MATLESVNAWIQANVLESEVWDKSQKQELAVIQATRNLKRWYPNETLTDEIVAYQAIWEIQGVDPALKFQKQGVSSVSGDGERIDYSFRDKVAPEVREILGGESDASNVRLEGGMLL